MVAAAFSLTSIFTQAQIPAYVPEAGLQAWWSFSGNADDLSGNGLHGTIFGASPVADRFGNPESAYSFADSAYIITETGTGLPYGSAPRTISLWMKTSITTNPNNRDIFGYGVVGPSQSYYFTIFDGSPYFCAAYDDLMGLGQIGDDVWHHVAITYNGSLVSIYLDGTLNASSQKNLNTQLSEVIFGRSPMTHPSPYYFDGLLDDCGIWNRVLTQEEINALYNGTTASIGINQASSELSIFPNPARERITISASASEAGKSYRIFDSKGILKLSGKMEGSRQEIKLHGFSSGIYSLLVEGSAARLLMVQNP